jgi:pyrimidine-nucleoside phosphorylase
MRVVDVIDKKRLGKELSRQEIEFIVLGFTHGDIPDYQMSAWLMAVVWRGMSQQELDDLTMTMANSGDVLDMSSFPKVVLDKHSTGGVGDKTTLVVAPLVASLGVAVGKMSGRGLGHTGGTLDKLEAIPGFKVDFATSQFMSLLAAHGIVVAGQSAELAPADGKMYALRDVTATVASVPLIASSIMSKKIATGTGAVVLDVKTGRGAFMETEDEAIDLAEVMVRLGHRAGRRMSAVISDMQQPLGCAVGNALEVAEAIDTLQGEGPEDFVEHCLVVAAEMLHLADVADGADARLLLLESIRTGAAVAKFREWVGAQGGDPAVVDNRGLMPQARLMNEALAPQDGFVADLNALTVGRATVALGAGRRRKGDPVDHAVGIVLQKKVGDTVRKGEPLARVYANDEAQLAEAMVLLLGAYRWSVERVEPPALIRRIVREG